MIGNHGSAGPMNEIAAGGRNRLSGSMTDGKGAPTRLSQALQMIDQANAQDPRLERWDGVDQPKELLYGRRMSAWLERLLPGASEVLQIAVRAQHIRRWEHPRASYPEGRAGYLRWRTDLYGFHAEEAAEIMRGLGYREEAAERVRALLAKKLIRSDPEAAALEDVACLVFLEFYFADFAPGHDPEKVVAILRKTWAKMSEAGRQAALTLELPAAARALMREALGEA